MTQQQQRQTSWCSACVKKISDVKRNKISKAIVFRTVALRFFLLCSLCVWFFKQAVGVSVIEGIDVSAEDSGDKIVTSVRERLGEGGTLDYVICNAG